MAIPTDVDGTWGDSGGALDGGELRRADAGIFAGIGSALGVGGGIARHGDTSLSVTVDGSDVVTVQPGAWVVPGNAVAGSGCWRYGLATAITGSLAARNATNPRITLVVARALDTSVVGAHAAYKGRIEFIDGTPSGSPTAPSLPTMAVELARITVPATGGGAASVDLSNRTYVTAIGGQMVVPTAARLPASAAKYQRARVLDTGLEYTWTGSAWSGVGSRSWARKTSDETVTSSTSLQDDNHLSFPVLAGGVYKFEAVLFAEPNTTGANGDIKVGFTFPTGTMNFTGSGPNASDLTTNTNANGEFIARTAASSGSSIIPYGLSQSATSPIGIVLWGTFVATDAGTVQLQWAQNSSSSNATRVTSGSSLFAEQVA